MKELNLYIPCFSRSHNFCLKDYGYEDEQTEGENEDLNTKVFDTQQQKKKKGRRDQKL